MSSSEQRILHKLRQLRKATRPQLAAASGLSLVTVNQAIEKLSTSGEVKAIGTTASGGGRPVMLYEYHEKHAYHILIYGQREGNTLAIQLEEITLTGNLVSRQEGRFAYIDHESFDGWIDDIAHRHRIKSITLSPMADILNSNTARHLKERYHCRIKTPSVAAMLAEQQEAGVTLCLPRGGEASCAYSHGHQVHECGEIALLPLLCAWENIDADEHATQEEFIARLIQIITCVLAPPRLCLYTPPMSTRLMERIRYNATTKLRGKLPPLQFKSLDSDYLLTAMREYAVNQC